MNKKYRNSHAAPAVIGWHVLNAISRRIGVINSARLADTKDINTISKPAIFTWEIDINDSENQKVNCGDRR